jgi:AAA+ ATPase superfamily predicted ATPase
MEKFVANPFKFGDPVHGDFYLPRPELLGVVKNFLSNRIHVVLIGPRRFGKTSFVLNLLETFEKDDYSCILVDIFNITSHRDFLHQFLRAIRIKKTFGGKIRDWWDGLKNIVPKLTADFDPNTGGSSLGFTLDHLSEPDIKSTIQDLLESLSHLGKRVIVAIDEFQKISEIDDHGWLEATIRTHFQRLPNVSFLFTGSRKSIISEMLNNPSRPLYRSCQMIEFPSFGSEFTIWVVARFKSIGIECDPRAINRLRELVQETPNYVQMVCFHLVSRGIAKVEIRDIEEALNLVARQNGYAYQTLMNSLTLAQQRALRLAAHENGAIFQKEILLKYEISSAPALYSSIKALKGKGILDAEGSAKGHVLFDDPLLAIWLRNCS